MHKVRRAMATAQALNISLPDRDLPSQIAGPVEKAMAGRRFAPFGRAKLLRTRAGFSANAAPGIRRSKARGAIPAARTLGEPECRLSERPRSRSLETPRRRQTQTKNWRKRKDQERATPTRRNSGVTAPPFRGATKERQSPPAGRPMPGYNRAL